MTQPYQSSATTKLIADRICDLGIKKTQAEIASEADFPNAKMMTFLKTGRNKVPLDRVPSLAKALEVDLRPHTVLDRESPTWAHHTKTAGDFEHRRAAIPTQASQAKSTLSTKPGPVQADPQQPAACRHQTLAARLACQSFQLASV